MIEAALTALSATERVRLYTARYPPRFDLLLTPAPAGVAPKHDAPDALAQLGQRAPFAGAFRSRS